MRRKHCEIKDPQEMIRILASTNIGRLATVDPEGYPYITPLNFVFHEGCVYFHCAPEGEKLDNLQSGSGPEQTSAGLQALHCGAPGRTRPPRGPGGRASHGVRTGAQRTRRMATKRMNCCQKQCPFFFTSLTRILNKSYFSML